MSALGSLVVKLGLDYAQYTGGLDKSEQAALAAAKKIQDTFDGMKAKVAATAGAIAGGLAAGFTIAAFKSIISGSIETGAALDDLRMQTGATVESLSALMAVGKFNNMGPEQIGGAMNKLASNLASATEEGKGAGKALQALGIDFDKFKLMRPEEQMQTVAKAMAQFEDGTGKSAIAMALYSKQGAQMLPFLHDLAELGDLQAKVTTEQAAAAANLDDNLTRLSTSGEAWKKELANGMIPALDLGAQALLDVMNGTGGLRDEVRALVADGSIGQWTKSAVTGLTYVADAATYVMRGVKVLAESLGAYAAAGVAYFGGVGTAIAKAISGDFSGAIQSLNSGTARAGAVMSDLGDNIIQTFSADTLGSRIRARMSEIEAAGGAAIEARKQLEFVNSTDKPAKAAKEAKDPFDALRDSVVKATAAYQAEATAGEKLTEGQKKAVEVLDQLRTGKVQVTEAQAVQIAKDIEAMLAAEGENKAREEFIKSADAERAARLKTAQAMEQSAASLEEQNRALRDEIELIGLTDAAQLRVLRQRNEAIILTKEATLAELERASAITGTMTREQIALQAEIEALRERNQLLGARYDKTVVAKAAQEASGEWTKFTDSIYNGLSDSLYRGFEAGKGFFKSFWDGIKNTAKTTVLKFGVQGIMTGVSGFLGLGGTAANAANGASGGGAGGLLNMASMANSAYSLYSGGFGGTALGQLYSGYTGATLAPGMMGPSATPITMWSQLGNGAGGAGMSGLAGAGAFAAVAAVVLNALGAFKSERKVGGGLMGTLGSGSISPWEEWREGGTLFSGPSYSTMNPVAELEKARDRLARLQAMPEGQGRSIERIAQQQAVVDQLEATYGALADATAKQSKTIQTAYDAMRKSAGDMADTLGLSSEAARNFTTRLGGDKGLNFDGLKPEEQQAKLAEALATANNEIAQQIIGTWVTTTSDVSRIVSENVGSAGEDMSLVYSQLTDTITTTRYVASEYAKDGEKAIDTLTRLSSSLTTVNGIWENLGNTVYEASLAGADAANTMAEAFGGLENMAAITGAYYDQYYNAEEKRANVERQVNDALAELNIRMPDINAEDAQAQYRALAEAQDRNTEEGRKAYVVILQNAAAFASITKETEAATTAASAARDASFSALERAVSAEQKILQTRISVANEIASTVGGLFDLLHDNVRELYGEVDATRASQAQGGSDFIAKALETARASGYLPDADKLAEAISDVRAGLDASNFANAEERNYAALVLAGQLSGLEKVAGKQLTDAQRTVRELEVQTGQLDQTLEYWRDLIAISNGNYQATLSLTEAIEAMRRDTVQNGTTKPGSVNTVGGGTTPEAGRGVVPRAAYGADEALGSFEKFKAWYNGIRSSADPKVFMDQGYQVPDWMRIHNGADDGTDKEQFGSYLFFKNNPQYAKDFEQIYSTGRSSFATDGSTLVRSDLSKMPTEVADYYKGNRDALLMTEGFGLDPVLAYQLYNFGPGQFGLDQKKQSFTEWLQNTKWTPDGLVANNNVVALAQLNYPNYKLPRWDTSTGNIVDLDGRMYTPDGKYIGNASRAQLEAIYGAGYVASNGGQSSLYNSQVGGGASEDDYYGAIKTNLDQAIAAGWTAQQLVDAVVTTGASMRDVATAYGISMSQLEENLRAGGATNIPGFAGGGSHFGGLRIVGERGWELEATGPSRIWNQQQLADAIGGGGSSLQLGAWLQSLVDEVRMLRRAVDQGAAYSSDMADALRAVKNGNSLIVEMAPSGVS